MCAESCKIFEKRLTAIEYTGTSTQEPLRGSGSCGASQIIRPLNQGRQRIVK